MKIKRYFAADMRQAMRMVREEQGPDAVILSNRQIDGGIEILAAIDFDESTLRQQAVAEQPRVPPVTPFSQPSPRPAGYDPLDDLRVTASLRDSFAEPAPTTKACVSYADEPSRQPRPRNQADRPTRASATTGRTTSAPDRSQSPPPVDPQINEMRNEIRDLREMLQGQIAGLAWGDLGRRHPLRARLLRYLMQLGISADVARDIAAAVPEDVGFERAAKLSLQLFINKISIASDDILNQGGVVALIGPTGVGKTTTIAKLAARYALRHGKDRVALVTTDNYRIGAHEQLRTFARILGVPLHAARDAADLSAILAELPDKELVLIDTAGMSQRDVRLSEQLALLRGNAQVARNYLVMSATSQIQALDETVRAYAAADVSGCIITKVDECACLGDVLSVVIRHGVPVTYISDGQKVPEDIHPARADNLAHRCIEMAQNAVHDYDETSVELSYGRMAVNAHI